MSVNKVILVGRLGADPELKNTPSGASVCNFSIATTESWNDKNGGGRQEKTEWHRVVAWNKLADLCGQYLAKGRQVYLEGRIQTRSWDDKEGNKRYTTEIMAQTIQFLGSKNDISKIDEQESGQNFSSNKSTRDAGAPLNEEESFASDDIPF